MPIPAGQSARSSLIDCIAVRTLSTRLVLREDWKWYLKRKEIG